MCRNVSKMVQCVKCTRTDDRVDFLASRGEEAVKSLGLDEGAGKTIEDEALLSAICHVRMGP